MRIRVLPENSRSLAASRSANWARRLEPRPAEFEISNLKSQISVAACANPEAEAVFAAREILKFVRDGNRFRDCAILVRNLENYHQPLARVFRRYGIPFFLDRRESVAHHPLAELTRSALRTSRVRLAAQRLVRRAQGRLCARGRGSEIDRLENAALESGWRGKKWREPLPDEFSERLRQKILPPFENFSAQLGEIKTSAKRRATGRRPARTLEQPES